MQLEDQFRRYFGTDDLAGLPAEALAAGIEHIQVDLGLAKDSGQRFALWALLYMLGAAPELEATFKDAGERDAARTFMDLAGQVDASSE